MRNVLHVFSFIVALAVSHPVYGSDAGSQHVKAICQIQNDLWFSIDDMNEESHCTNNDMQKSSNLKFTNRLCINQRNICIGVIPVNNIVKKASTKNRLKEEENK